jgi:hypothetical protein
MVRQMARQMRYLLIAAIASLLLTSCVDADLSIRFDSQTHGQITQTLHLSDRLRTAPDQLFERITAKAKALSGKARQSDHNTLQIVLPFNSGEQLVARFNAFYGNAYDSAQSSDNLSGLALYDGAPPVSAHLALQQSNYFFALRDHLVYDLQVESLPAHSGQLANSKLSDLSWLNLDFHLSTPWGVTLSDPPTADNQGQTVTWHLSADRPQHIEATFWLPSPIGIGAGAIAAFCLLGYLVKYRLLRPS